MGQSISYQNAHFFPRFNFQIRKCFLTQIHRIIKEKKNRIMCLCSISKIIQLSLFVIEHDCLYGTQSPLLNLEVHAFVVLELWVLVPVCTLVFVSPSCQSPIPSCILCNMLCLGYTSLSSCIWSSVNITDLLRLHVW